MLKTWPQQEQKKVELKHLTGLAVKQSHAGDCGYKNSCCRKQASRGLPDDEVKKSNRGWKLFCNIQRMPAA